MWWRARPPKPQPSGLEPVRYREVQVGGLFGFPCTLAHHCRWHAPRQRPTGSACRAGEGILVKGQPLHSAAMPEAARWPADRRWHMSSDAWQHLRDHAGHRPAASTTASDCPALCAPRTKSRSLDQGAGRHGPVRPLPAPCGAAFLFCTGIWSPWPTGDEMWGVGRSALGGWGGVTSGCNSSCRRLDKRWQQYLADANRLEGCWGRTKAVGRALTATASSRCTPDGGAGGSGGGSCGGNEDQGLAQATWNAIGGSRRGCHPQQSLSRVDATVHILWHIFLCFSREHTPTQV